MLHFTTKARTLAALQNNLQGAVVAPLIYFTVEQWQNEKESCIKSIQTSLKDCNMYIVRSSRICEDSLTQSNAGAYLSIQDVEKREIAESIDRVIASYDSEAQQDEVLIQPMLQGVTCSGVAFSHDPHTCAPYRIINYTYGTDTAHVTSGKGGHTWQHAAASPFSPPAPLDAVVSLIEQLLDIFDQAPLDIEFALTEDNTLWLLQARPLILSSPPENNAIQSSRLQEIYATCSRSMGPHPFLMGEKTVFGVMPDWNPAEIIGIRPKPLALSLYRELVTDAIWAYQRHNYGYRNLRSFPLMPHFFGLPYIDVRLSFNSFIPDDLEEGLASRLVDYYINTLLKTPTLHDKVEFEIVFSCYTLDLPERLCCLQQAGFSAEECTSIADSLRRLTNRIVHPREGLWHSDAAKLDILTKRQQMLAPLPPLQQIYWLLEDAKRYGTLPFAGLARAGFIAVQMLKSLVSVGIFTQDDYDAFMRSVSTVSSQMAQDRAAMSKSAFLEKYGHLRQGTYDILSPRYDEAPDLYFDWDQKIPAFSKAKPFSITLPQMRALVHTLQTHNLQIDPVELFNFLQAAIELREFAKFHFTRNLSDALVLMQECASHWGFSREDIAYAEVSVFRELAMSVVHPRKLMTHSVVQGRARYAETCKLSLPPLITAPKDIWGFAWPATSPNFITQKQATGPVMTELQQGSVTKSALAGSIVCIPSADPGFDWLFAFPLAGLITAWGGANSHMAIRAGELGLPAVIGAGEQLYAECSQAKHLHIDCAAQKIDILS